MKVLRTKAAVALCALAVAAVLLAQFDALRLDDLLGNIGPFAAQRTSDLEMKRECGPTRSAVPDE